MAEQQNEGIMGRREFKRIKAVPPPATAVPKRAPCGLSERAIVALWSVFGPESKLTITPGDMPTVLELQQWIQAQAQATQTPAPALERE